MSTYEQRHVDWKQDYYQQDRAPWSSAHDELLQAAKEAIAEIAVDTVCTRLEFLAVLDARLADLTAHTLTPAEAAEQLRKKFCAPESKALTWEKMQELVRQLKQTSSSPYVVSTSPGANPSTTYIDPRGLTTVVYHDGTQVITNQGTNPIYIPTVTGATQVLQPGESITISPSQPYQQYPLWESQYFAQTSDNTNTISFPTLANLKPQEELYGPVNANREMKEWQRLKAEDERRRHDARRGR